LTICEAGTKPRLLLLSRVLPRALMKLPLLFLLVVLPCALMKLPLVLLLVVLLGVTKFLELLLVLPSVMKPPLLFLVLMPPCEKVLLLGGPWLTSSLHDGGDAIEVLRASTSLGNRS
jgi:hypothetical protein